MLNYVVKHGQSSATSLGVIALIYSGFGVLLSYVRGADDELNTLAAGTATGLLYKSTSGLRRCAIGGGVGFALAAAYSLYASGDRLRQIFGFRNKLSSY
ncbi:unnamed protein product [Soboliphyme baturini]|uniref:Complex I-B14.7 n=1 Tax=Soboliphyme baturini TaxID=241478 RepID=A0A183IZ51_9BILA|nr:unnamed protein product [Soboliphyme baturini]